MVAPLALGLASLMLEAQNARNAVFPEAIHCPVIALGFLAFSAALDHLLLFEGNPLRGYCPRLVALTAAIGPLSCDACGALAEGDATWTSGDEDPTQAELDQELSLLRAELHNAIPQMIQWRLNIGRPEGIRYDRFQHALMVTIDELHYHENFGPLQAIRSAFARSQVLMQQALVDRTETIRGAAPIDLDLSQ